MTYDVITANTMVAHLTKACIQVREACSSHRLQRHSFSCNTAARSGGTQMDVPALTAHPRLHVESRGAQGCAKRFAPPSPAPLAPSLAPAAPAPSAPAAAAAAPLAPPPPAPPPPPPALDRHIPAKAESVQLGHPLLGEAGVRVAALYRARRTVSGAGRVGKDGRGGRVRGRDGAGGRVMC